MLERDERVAFYRAVAAAICNTELGHQEKIRLISQVHKELRSLDPRFDLEKFNMACWGEEW